MSSVNRGKIKNTVLASRIKFLVVQHTFVYEDRFVKTFKIEMKQEDLQSHSFAFHNSSRSLLDHTDAVICQFFVTHPFVNKLGN